MGRFGEIDEKISCEEYTSAWSQSKVFLVVKTSLACLDVCSVRYYISGTKMTMMMMMTTMHPVYLCNTLRNCQASYADFFVP